MSQKIDIKELLESVDLEAIGRQVAKVLLDWLTKPELLELLNQLRDAQGRTQPERVVAKAVCSEEGCQEPVRAKGLCAKHYQRQRYAKKREESPRTSGRGFGECSVEGCTRKVHAREMCGAHFMEWVRAKRKADDSAL